MKNIHQKIISDILKARPKNQVEFLKLKKKFSGKYNLAPVTNATLIKAYGQILPQGKKRQNLSSWLTKRKTRTLSGVTPLTVLTKPYPCPGRCLYCPQEPGMPKSYLAKEPAAQRAKMNDFDPARQVEMRIRALAANGHAVDKIELLILGGSFNAYPKNYQQKFIQRCFEAVNGKKSANLKRAFKKNETAEHRIIGVTIETRPDLINQAEIKRFRELGVTRVQIGVQHLDDQILKLVRRGHTAEQTVTATKLLKTAGFKVDYHLMPDLPGSTPAKDLKMFHRLFTEPNFQPDQIKIYPTVVNEYAPLYQWFSSGQYRPYAPEKLAALLIKIKLTVPYYVRINRLIRDIPKESIAGGNKITNLREFLQAELKKKNLKCKCMRCREARESLADLKKAKLFTQQYSAAGGTEYFISYESAKREKLYSFIRLRLNGPAELKNNFIPELRNALLVREIHTYGPLVPVKQRRAQIQHTGFGKRLMKIAEKVALKNKLSKIAVIAGIGVRPYYRKLGYKLQGTYMIKNLEVDAKSQKLECFGC
ncbi:MAG TPA: tRNA uridine(34) 5-carboxymethylaminomethyl modification radical SAM/GNAT enzyme Elp3 [Candidatus Komeilibacteria bacterium]|nr:tRNA uridine(34) 5-carboxymethylaminomethyl modification radical SAM/GNAT enzyme Elp3 [Candidatus Komeilibacteria bacterium]